LCAGACCRVVVAWCWVVVVFFLFGGVLCCAGSVCWVLVLASLLGVGQKRVFDQLPSLYGLAHDS
jgi:hypothetical protein